jgi:hypothetical protein
MDTVLLEEQILDRSASLYHAARSLQSSQELANGPCPVPDEDPLKY